MNKTLYIIWGFADNTELARFYFEDNLECLAYCWWLVYNFESKCEQLSKISVSSNSTVNTKRFIRNEFVNVVYKEIYENILKLNSLNELKYYHFITAQQYWGIKPPIADFLKSLKLLC